MTRTRFHQGLEELKDKLLRMAGMAERTPNTLASYEAAQTTDRLPRQATTTGLPRKAGSSLCSTEA